VNCVASKFIFYCFYIRLFFSFQPVQEASLVTSDPGRFASIWCTAGRDAVLPWPGSNQSVSTRSVTLLNRALPLSDLNMSTWLFALCKTLRSDCGWHSDRPCAVHRLPERNVKVTVLRSHLLPYTGNVLDFFPNSSIFGTRSCRLWRWGRWRRCQGHNCLSHFSLGNYFMSPYRFCHFPSIFQREYRPRLIL